MREGSQDVDQHGLPRNYFGPSQDYPVRKPLPDVPINLPNRYYADRNVIVFDKQIFNAMPATLYRDIQKSAAYLDSDTVPPGQIPGITQNIMLVQHNGINYWLTASLGQALQKQLGASDLADRSRSDQSRFARGEKLSAMPTGTDKATAGATDQGTVRPPMLPFERDPSRAGI